MKPLTLGAGQLWIHIAAHCTLNHPILNYELQIQDHDVTTQIWGLTYAQIWSKMQILEGYAEFEFLPTLRGVIILLPSQPRFLARLPR